MRSSATTRADEPRGHAESWWREGVIYQVYPRSFQDSDGDGVGDLAGIQKRLGYLARLGVDAIWLNPFYPSPMLDFGYDVCDHADVDPLFGTLADFDALLADAHAHGLRVLIDFVPNHTSSEHPWFRDARSSRTSSKRDWYFWRDPRPDGSPPNNWASPFGGSQWTLDERSGQYYLHTFHPEQPDLNWRNPDVERAMLDVLRFWLERGVDGFRIDVANFVLKDPQLRDNPPNPTAGTSSYKYLGHYDTQLHLHDKGHPDCHPLYRRIRRLLDSYSRDGSDRIALGEIHLYEWPEWTRHWAAYYGEQLDELHLPLNFTLVGLRWPQLHARRPALAGRRLPRRRRRNRGRPARRRLAEPRPRQPRRVTDRHPHRPRAGQGRDHAPAQPARHPDPLLRRRARHGGRRRPGRLRPRSLRPARPGPRSRPRAHTDAMGRRAERRLLPGRRAALAPARR